MGRILEDAKPEAAYFFAVEPLGQARRRADYQHERHVRDSRNSPSRGSSHLRRRHWSGSVPSTTPQDFRKRAWRQPGRQVEIAGGNSWRK